MNVILDDVVKDAIMDLWRIKESCSKLYFSKSMRETSRQEVLTIIRSANDAIRNCLCVLEEPEKYQSIADHLDWQESCGMEGKELKAA